MTVEKLPSGSYRVRMTFNHKRYSLVFDHKPTEAEVMLEFSKKVENAIDCKHITFETAANEYCKVKKNVLSPSTYREYMRTPQRLSKDFINMYIDEISYLHIQQEVSRLAADKSAKTVKNYYCFIMSVLRLFITNYEPEQKIKLPMIVEEEPYIPEYDIVKKLIDYSLTESKGIFYIPCMLGTYGLRRSEVCALTPDDFNGNVVHINKSMVMNYDNEWIIKEYPKTETSVRDIPVKQSLVDLINSQGYVYKGHPNSISKFIDRFCKKNDINHFSLHSLRHYFCSELSAENIDIETSKHLSGHKTDYVYNRYRHMREKKIKEAKMKLDSILFK